MTRKNPREPHAEVSALFTDRWSPRAFREDPVPQEQLDSLFEAARWAPSCFNEQPAVFAFARTPADRERFAQALTEGNRAWAARAPVLMFVLARRHFARNGEINRWAVFDAGAAWMSLALQARMLGLSTHAMAGFDRDEAIRVLGVDPETYEVVAAIALGRRGDAGMLDEERAAKEVPNNRRPLEEVSMEGRGPGPI